MLFCLGLGYSALQYVRDAQVPDVCGTVRDAAGGAIPPGIRSVLFDPSSDGLRSALSAATRILVSIPPDESGDPVLRQFEDALPRRAPVVYLSSLGVYGDAQGRNVTEESACNPQFPRSQARLAAERAWIAAARQKQAPLAVLRLAGIYGPERNALVALKRGQARRIHKAGQVFNRVHVEDIAQAIGAAFARETSGVFNVADDEPSPPGDPIVFAAGLLGIEPPPAVPFEEASRTMSPMARSFYEECRRADNTKLKTVLGVRLRYPSYREGLRALFAAGEGR